jgi:hypothetical protein
MKKKRRSKAARSKLVPTHALHCFYDPLQLRSQQPRQGDFTAKIERQWADMTTAELQAVIDEFTTEVLRRAFAGEYESVDTFALKVSNLVRWLQDLTYRQAACCCMVKNGKDRSRSAAAEPDAWLGNAWGDHRFRWFFW